MKRESDWALATVTNMAWTERIVQFLLMGENVVNK